MKNQQALIFIGVGLLTTTIALEQFVTAGLSTIALAILTGLGSMSVAVSLWIDRPRTEWIFVSLGSVFCLYYGISYGFAVLGTTPPFAARVLPNGLDSVDLVALPAGMLAWLLGYKTLHVAAMTRAARQLILPTATRQPVGPITLLAFFATTVLARVALLVSGAGFGYLRDGAEITTTANTSTQYVEIYGQFGVVIIGLTILASRFGKGGIRHIHDGYSRAFYWMIPIEVTFRMLAGSKSGLFLVLLMVLFALAATGRLSLSPRRAGAAGLVAVLVVFPLFGTYRDILNQEASQSASPARAPVAAIAAVKQSASTFTDGPGPYAQLAFDQTTGRFREIDRAAVSIQAHDGGRPYSAPSEIVERIGSALIPRLLWPGKPNNLYALETSRSYYGLSNVISASSLSPVGDAYRYGGLAMVALALALLGGFVRFLDEMLAPRHSIWLVPLLIAAIPMIRGGDLAALFVGAVRYFLILGVLSRLLFVRERQSGLGQRRHNRSSEEALIGISNP